MMKLTNPVKLKTIAKGAFAIVLAGSFSFAGTSAFADGNDQTTNQTATQQTNTSDTASVSTQNQQTPSLVPGDFFYFAKILFEKIQLALTFDQTKEAKLLASNASERLAEAQALFAAGDQQKAVDTLKASLDDMNSAEQIVEKEDGQDEDSAKTATAAADDSSTTSVAEDSTTATAGDAKDAAQSKDSTELKDVKNQLAQSIKALETALQKGHKSDAARKAIEKNIAKLSARLNAGPAGSTDNGPTTTSTADTKATTDPTTTAPVDPAASTAPAAAVSTETAGTNSTAATSTAATSTAAAASTDGAAVQAPAPAPAPAQSGTTTAANHGKVVSEAAKQTTGSAQNHGQAVSQVANQNSENHQANSEKGKH